MFDHLGPIEHGAVELGDLTVFCGKNNTGKTYVSYLIYGFYHYLSKNISLRGSENFELYQKMDQNNCDISLDALKEYLPKFHEKICKSVLDNVPQIFNVKKSFFEQFSFEVEAGRNLKEITYDTLKNVIKDVISNVDGAVIKEISRKKLRLNLPMKKQSNDDAVEAVTILIILFTLCGILYEDPDCSIYMLPAERSGLNIFYKELNVNRNNVLFELSENINGGKKINSISKYPLPISEYINLLNSMEIEEEEQSVYSEFAAMLEKKIVHGAFTVLDNGKIDFTIEGEKKIDFHLSSSTAKSLFGLDYLLKNKLDYGSYLIIDEPEQNLHPDNQRYIARLIAQMVNSGIKVIISTHSDYIIKELNNLILLGNKFNGYEKLMAEYGYEETELLSYDKVKGFVFHKSAVEPVPVNEKGLQMDIFDEVINSMNESSDDIYYSYCEVAETDEEEW